jgi:putative salt-induced outer membrane protein YdiY
MINKQNKISWLLFLSFFAINLSSQAIVNIENLRNENMIGVFQTLSASLDASRGNQDRDNYAFSYRVDKNTKSIESFIILNKSERQRNNETSDESTFFHGRLVLRSETKTDFEFLGQISENPFKKYKRRKVFGAGFRIAIDEDIRLGIQFLREDEEDLLSRNITTNRYGFYAHDDFSLMENVSLNATLYFQPAIDDFNNDYKASALLGVDFTVNQALNFSIEYSYARDSMPPINSDKIDEAISTKFIYRF